MKTRSAAHVEHTREYHVQPKGISNHGPSQSIPVQGEDGAIEYEVDSIISHRKRGPGYQWLTLM